MLIKIRTVYIDDTSPPGTAGLFTVFATAADDRTRYYHRGPAEHGYFTERQAAELAMRVRRRGTIDLDHWSPVSRAYHEMEDDWLNDFMGVR